MMSKERLEEELEQAENKLKRINEVCSNAISEYMDLNITVLSKGIKEIIEGVRE